MATYHYYPTEHFTDRLQKIKRKDPNGHSRINEVIGRLLANPDDADGRMRGTYHGRFKKYVGRKDYRLIYYYCELCRKQQKRLEERCDHCDRVRDNSVIFFEVFHKNELKKLKENDF